MNDSVKEFYAKTYPTDDMVEDIIDSVTFQEVYDSLRLGKDIYKTIGASDSLVRERVFLELANKRQVEYGTIYDLWLGRY